MTLSSPAGARNVTPERENPKRKPVPRANYLSKTECKKKMQVILYDYKNFSHGLKF